MLTTLLLGATLAAAPPALDDHAAAIRAAGKDVPKLLELAEAYVTGEDADAARAAFARVIELDEDNEAARRGLGHKRYDDQWFETYAALSAHRRAEARHRLEAFGEVRFRDAWVPVAHVPFLRMGWVRADEVWRHPDDAAAAAEAAKLTEAGWQQQDGVWIHPDEFDKWRGGQWKVGDAWVDKDAANAHHAELDAMWEIPGEHFVGVTTCDRDTAAWVPWWADQTHADLVRLFGVAPTGKPRVICVRDIPQYNVFAGGDPATGRAPSEGNGWSSVHYAFLADALFDNDATPARWHGTGACYYDVNDPALKPYGQHAVRHAAGQAFVEALDPSWDHVSRVVAGETAFSSVAFWAEKRLPLWLRYGACAYVERYFEDRTVEAGAPNRWWARDWALENLRATGLPELEAVFGMTLDPNDAATSGQRIQEAGLLVSFVLDGGCAPVEEAHAAFQEAVRSGEGLDDAVADLETALRRNEKKLRLYAGL